MACLHWLAPAYHRRRRSASQHSDGPRENSRTAGQNQSSSSARAGTRNGRRQSDPWHPESRPSHLFLQNHSGRAVASDQDRCGAGNGGSLPGVGRVAATQAGSEKGCCRRCSCRGSFQSHVGFHHRRPIIPPPFRAAVHCPAGANPRRRPAPLPRQKEAGRSRQSRRRAPGYQSSYRVPSRGTP